MFSTPLTEYAHEVWAAARDHLGTCAQQLQPQLEKTSGDKRLLLELALGTLPVSDLASVPFSVLEAYADHALFLRENSPYCRDVPEDIFLHCVYYPRINSEELVDCRRFFYDQLQPEVEGLPARQAALAVNRWCAAQMTYESTDLRTIHPLTAYSCGLGRCGEESTFGVTALRAVGLPARQIYVPWWSHCDDNHAWVEVYTGDGWHFLGACEPEPELDRGWFVNASSRAMVVVSRRFFDYSGEGLQDEQLVLKDGICLAYNQVGRYAQTTSVTVTVHTPEGKPAVGAWVRFYVENTAAAACIAALETDENGQVQLEVGLGSCMVEAEYNGQFAWETITVDAPKQLVLVPKQTEPMLGIRDWDFSAPKTGHKHNAMLTPTQQEEKAKTLQLAKQKRLARIQGYWKESYQTGDPALDRVFHLAVGHAQALWEFYQTYGQRARQMLLHLTEKDWRDADTAVLAAHLQETAQAPNQNDETFLSYVQCPRIGYETLSDWRSAVEQTLTAEQKEIFRVKPEELWAWILENFREGACRWHPVLWLQPEAALKLGAADEKGRRLLFVAVLRTLGVPARLDPVDGRAQYLSQDGFCTVEADAPQEPQAILHVKADASMTYGQSWGLSRWCCGWQPLEWESRTEELSLAKGTYCLHTVNRLPNGNQLIRQETFRLDADRVLSAEKRQAAPEQLLANDAVSLPVPAQGLECQFYLECGAEPTEHVLNELREAADRVRAQMSRGLNLRFLLPNARERQDPTLQKTLAVLPDVTVEEADFTAGTLETLARSLYLEPGLWPLMTLTDGRISYYGHAGYAVGTVGLALDLAAWVLEKSESKA